MVGKEFFRVLRLASMAYLLLGILLPRFQKVVVDAKQINAYSPHNPRSVPIEAKWKAVCEIPMNERHQGTKPPFGQIENAHVSVQWSPDLVDGQSAVSVTPGV
jgi:hypothetical protein